MAKFIFITGGVVSSLGKGISGASIGKLLQLSGFKVNMVKFDPYINVDPGTMNPYQHGEVYVTTDGAESDLDLGTYERFLDIYTTKANTNTSGDIYQTVINRERRGDYDGATVQVIPHITDEIKSRFFASSKGYDITIIEIGGTVGDIEGLPFMEAVRQFQLENKKDVFSIHVSYIPYIAGAHELKTKPTQHSVTKLREIGISPDMIICRTEYSLDEGMKKKLSLFCNVKEENVVEAKDAASIYFIPQALYNQNVDKIIIKQLNIKPKKKFDATWFKKIKEIAKYKKEVKIAVVGKYADLKDAYKSIDESLNIAAWSLGAKAKVDYLGAEDKNLAAKLKGYNAILVPGGFGNRGIEGKIKSITYARQNNIPFLGICLGMQCSVIEASRNLAGFDNANSTEFDEKAKHPVIKILDEQRNVKYRGGTMRLGNYKSEIKKGTRIHSLYGKTEIEERHRHRYEVNPEYISALEKKGFIVTGYHKGILPETIEIPKHPFFIGVQFHPEFGSRPMKPHPLFKGFVEAAIKNAKSKR
ncbi:CTP synthase [Endomicrobium proavitum]|uniref:CTP synthase n=1 Tax=Endomicrobium proavitum TaxID=1408281 RepID=A0A0G3WIN4_9BACT|nr:CTP synthase [Endomicrobium proavitum]AKL97750.1 CTP synthase [Endomicrobium proavitum]